MAKHLMVKTLPNRAGCGLRGLQHKNSRPRWRAQEVVRYITTSAVTQQPALDLPIPRHEKVLPLEHIGRKRRLEALKEAKPFSEFSEFLTDNYQRQHDYLRISITERCNLRCLYCMPEEGVSLSPPAHLLTTPEIFYLSSLFVSQGVTKIRLTGGEPTVRRDILPLMRQIGSLRSKGLREIALTTNGLLLHRKLDAMVEAGLTGVNMSLDTLDPFQFQIMTRRKGFDAVMRSIDRILEMNKLGAGIKLKINCVVMRGMNEREIIPFVEMGREKDIEVRFIEYMPFGGNKWSKGKMLSYKEMLDMIRQKYPDIHRVQGHKNDTSKTFKVPGFVGRIGFITSMTEDFCGSCNRLRITGDGNLKVCLHGNAEVSLRDMLRESNDGNPIDDEAFEALKQVEMDRNQGRLAEGTTLGWGERERKLLDIIGTAVKRKKEKHAGMGELENMENRPMILIETLNLMATPQHPTTYTNVNGRPVAMRTPQYTSRTSPLILPTHLLSCSAKLSNAPPSVRFFSHQFQLRRDARAWRKRSETVEDWPEPVPPQRAPPSASVTTHTVTIEPKPVDLRRQATIAKWAVSENAQNGRTTSTSGTVHRPNRPLIRRILGPTGGIINIQAGLLETNLASPRTKFSSSEELVNRVSEHSIGNINTKEHRIKRQPVKAKIEVLSEQDLFDPFEEDVEDPFAKSRELMSNIKVDDMKKRIRVIDRYAWKTERYTIPGLRKDLFALVCGVSPVEKKTTEWKLLRIGPAELARVIRMRGNEFAERPKVLNDADSDPKPGQKSTPTIGIKGSLSLTQPFTPTPSRLSVFNLSRGSQGRQSRSLSTQAWLSEKSQPKSATLTHLNSASEVHMVDVGGKEATHRTAIASGSVHFSNAETYSLIKNAQLKKGDVLSVARVAGIMAAKNCPLIIPLCHPISITSVTVDLELIPGNNSASAELVEGVPTNNGSVAVQATVKCYGPTGVEMEALTAVSGACLTIIDMIKAVDREAVIGPSRVVLKIGGRSGDSGSGTKM